MLLPKKVKYRNADAGFKQVDQVVVHTPLLFSALKFPDSYVHQLFDFLELGKAQIRIGEIRHNI